MFDNGRKALCMLQMQSLTPGFYLPRAGDAWGILWPTGHQSRVLLYRFQTGSVIFLCPINLQINWQRSWNQFHGTGSKDVMQGEAELWTFYKLNLAPSTLRHNSLFRVINSQSAGASICWCVFKLPAILELSTLLYYTRLVMPTALKKKKIPEEAKWKVGSNTFYDKVLSEIKGRIEFHLCTSRWPEGSIYLSAMELRVLLGDYFWFSLQGHATWTTFARLWRKKLKWPEGTDLCFSAPHRVCIF